MHAVYRMFDDEMCLLYIGVSCNLRLRMPDHVRKDWYGDINYISLERYTTREAAMEIKRRAIEKEIPLYNGNNNRTMKEQISRQRGWPQRSKDAGKQLNDISKLIGIELDDERLRYPIKRYKFLIIERWLKNCIKKRKGLIER